MKHWRVVIILAAAQFVMVLDTTVMNVAISDVVEDLDTTVTQVQLAITLYTLVMAALMLIGGKLGDILGRRRAFAIGLVIYGLGSLTTGASQSIEMLIFGWSGLEGIGAALVIPAIASLIAANYEGKDRIVAYGLVGAIAAVGVAAGPLIGGWVTEELSWRYVFFGEVVVIIGIIGCSRMIQDLPRPAKKPHLDLVGAALSAAGLALIVFGILRIPQWGLIQPIGGPTIGGEEVTPFGLSLVPFLIVGGGVLMTLFVRWCRRCEERGTEPLLKPDLFRIKQLRAGLVMLGSQQLILNGIFFVLPLYLQTVLGKNALETGIAIMPISVTMMIAALGAPKLAGRLSPRQIVRIGFFMMFLASIGLLATIDYELNGPGFSISLAAFGAGVGLLASQLGNVIMSSVESSRGSEAGGLQGTAQNLGASLGTALIGAVLLIGLGNATTNAVLADPAISAEVKQGVSTASAGGVEFVPAATVEQAVIDAGGSEADAAAVADDYAAGQLAGLRAAMLIAAIFVVFAFWFAKRLPDEPLSSPKPAAAAPAAT